jgi:hypothetical protein
MKFPDLCKVQDMEMYDLQNLVLLLYLVTLISKEIPDAFACRSSSMRSYLIQPVKNWNLMVILTVRFRYWPWDFDVWPANFVLR